MILIHGIGVDHSQASLEVDHMLCMQIQHLLQQCEMATLTTYVVKHCTCLKGKHDDMDLDQTATKLLEVAMKFKDKNMLYKQAGAAAASASTTEDDCQGVVHDYT